MTKVYYQTTNKMAIKYIAHADNLLQANKNTTTTILSFQNL